MSAKFNSFSYLHANFRVPVGGVYSGNSREEGSVLSDSEYAHRTSQAPIITDCDRKRSENSEHSPYIFGVRGWKFFNDMDV